MKLLPFISPLALTALIACSYGYPLIVTERGGAITFNAGNKHGTECLADFTVIDSRGIIMWDLYTDAYTPAPCQSRLPVIYGVVPSGMRVRVAAKHLMARAFFDQSGS